jgi:hypothetical protein
MESARKNHRIDFPWSDTDALATWKDWWADKEIARGQTASEMFLWSLMSACIDRISGLLDNTDALRKLNCRSVQGVEDALDACASQLQYQDRQPNLPPLLPPFDEIRRRYFPHFQEWIDALLRQNGPGISVQKYRTVAACIGAAYRLKMQPSKLSAPQWGHMVEFVRDPYQFAKAKKLVLPQSRGRWDGKSGYKEQLNAVYRIVSSIFSCMGASQAA